MAYPLSYIPLGQIDVNYLALKEGHQEAIQQELNWENRQVFNNVDIFAEAWELRIVHCDCGPAPTAPNIPAWTQIGNQLITRHNDAPPGVGEGGIAFAPEFKDNIVILQISQRFALEREAFLASLELINGESSLIEDIEVDISIVDASGTPVPLRIPGQMLTDTTPITANMPANSLVPTYTLGSNMPLLWKESAPVNFTIIPTAPTRLPSLGVAGSASDKLLTGWTLVPDAFGVTSPLGADFYVQAEISYKYQGVNKVISTTQALITVHPQPKILIDYFIPSYLYANQPTDWLVVATNVGYGSARNFSMEEPKVKILKQSDLHPTSFKFTGPSKLHFGKIMPGTQKTGLWKIQADHNGPFVDVQSACIHENYQGVELPVLVYCKPTIHWYNPPPPVDEAGQWGKDNACLVGNYQAYDSDPVNTYSGNFTYNHNDVSIDTWGLPLEFERAYNSRDDDDGPLGVGWTHNYNMALKYESFVPIASGNVLTPQNIISVRLPRGSRAYFEVSQDGNTITPYPGVTAQLMRQGDTYTLTQEGDQTQYIFGAEAAEHLVAIVDGHGNRINLTYSTEITVAERLLLSASDEAGRSLTFDYDENDRLIKLTDPLNRTALYTYTNGYLSSMSDFRAESANFTYTTPDTVNDLPGQLVSLVDANNNEEFFNHYDSARRVDWQRDATANQTFFAYVTHADDSQITTITHPLGNVRIDTYDAAGLLVRQEDDLGNFESYQYDDKYHMTQLIDKNGHETNYTRHECGVMATQTDPLNNTTSTTVNNKAQITSVTDERDFVTNYTYDLNELDILTITDPASETKTFEYGPRGELLSETNQNGHTTRYGYDSYGNTTVITNALGNTSHMSYDLAGRLLNNTDALNRQSSYSYDATDNLLAMHDALTGSTTFAYDAVGNRISTTDALNRVTSYEYDSRHNLIKINNALNGSQILEYDANNNLLRETDENSHVTTYQYDGLNRVLGVTNALTGTLEYSYDPMGNRLTEKDPKGNITQYNYDANDRVIETIFPDSSRMTATYDKADHLLTMTDGENRTVSYSYDALGRVESITDTLDSVTHYGYDGLGNQITLTDAEDRTTTYSYDKLNRLVSTTYPISGSAHITYNAVGNIINTTDTAGRTISMTYDVLDRLVEATDPLSQTTRFYYDALDNKVQEIDALGQSTHYSYDELNRLVSVTDALNQSGRFEYDDLGNLLKVIDAKDRTFEYRYDALNRQIFIIDPLNQTITMTYDANSNLLTSTDAENRSASYSYDVFNQLLTINAPEGASSSFVYDHVGNMISETDANNHTTSYIYDGLDRLIEMQDAITGSMTYTYDAVGNLLSETDPNDQTTTYFYDALNRLLTIRDVQGNEQSYGYDKLGNTVSMLDAEGRTASVVYDALDRPIKTIDALNQSTVFTYNAVGNQTAIADAKRRITTFEYDLLNRLTTSTDPLGFTTVFTYDEVSNLVANTNPKQQTTRFVYDELDRLTEWVDALNHSTSYTYDQVGNQLSVTDPENRSATFTYDGLNRLTHLTDAKDGVFSFAHDPVGNQIRVTNANTQTIHYNYDALNRLVEVIDPLNQSTEFVYDAVGNQIKVIDPKLRTTEYGYDNLHRMTEVKDPAGNSTTFTYNKVGNLLTSADAEGRTITTTYDALNRPLQIIDPLNGTTHLTYDEVGNSTQVENAKGQLTTFAYDALNRPVTITDSLNYATTTSYDAIGNVTQIENAKNQIQSFEYDALNRLIVSRDPITGVIQFGYDDVGNLTQITNPKGRVTFNTYDELDRVIRTVNNYVDGGPQNVDTNVSTEFVYDAIGNLTQGTNARSQSSSFQYDLLNRLISTADPLNNTTAYEYDEVGNTVAVVDPLSRRTELDYDLLDRLITVTDPLNRVTSYSYDKVGNQIGVLDAENIATRYNYDALNRLTSVTQNYIDGGPQNAATNVTTQFGYDAIGNLTQITDPNTHNQSFDYDALNRLTHREDGLANETTYQYDEISNLIQVTDPKSQITAYSYDNLNRLEGIVRPDETVDFTYDAVGNRLSMTDPNGITTYNYDALDRLTSFKDNANQTVQYSYDPNGNRTGLTYPDSQQVTYSYDPADRLISVEDWDTLLTTYNYDEASQLLEMTLPNNISGTYQYDEAGQLTNITYQSSLTNTQILATYDYAYDQVGNRIQATESVYAPVFTPTAVFSATPLVGLTPLTVTFVNSSTHATYFEWNFGDGTTLSETNTGQLSATHTYTESGIYTVSLLATNGYYTHTLTQTAYIAVVSPEAFQEENGLLVIEAEHFSQRSDNITHTWNTRTDLPGFVDSSYMQARPDIGGLYHTTALSRSPQLQYELNFVTSGTYTLWLYGAATNAAGNSVHVALDEQQPLALTGFAPNVWHWNTRQLSGPSLGDPTIITVDTPGPHTLNLWMREDGLRLDRILLVTDTAYLPSGSGPAESKRVTAADLALMSGSSSQDLLVKANTPASLTFEPPFDSAQNSSLVASRQPLPLENSPFGQNPTIVIMGPLAAAAPFANRRRRKMARLGWLILVLLLALAFFGIGTALAADIPLNQNAGIQRVAPYQNPTTINPAYSAGNSPYMAPDQMMARLTQLNQLDSLLASPLDSPLASQLASQLASPLANSPTITTTYAYDDLYRLTTATAFASDSSPLANYQYSYDPVGNRLAYLINSAQVATYTYDAANRLTQLNNQTHSYDDNGNLLNDGLFTYSYDSANRLTGLDSDLSNNTYTYNGDGIRIAQTADGIRTDYVQDMAAPLPQLLTSSAGGTVNRYLHGLGLIGEQSEGSGPVAPTTWQYHLPDALGSVRQVADPLGQILSSQRFDPFGGLESVNGLNQTAYGFAGEEQDESGHIFLRARTYNPATGRFLQQDRVMGNLSQPQTLHHYAYAFNNPVNYTDPSGNMPPLRAAPVQDSQGPRPIVNYNYSTAGTQSRSNSAYTPATGRVIRTAKLFSFNNSGRSVNSGGGYNMNRVQRYNAYGRFQSQGHRPANCGPAGSGGSSSFNPLDMLFGIRDAGRRVMDQAEWVINHPLEAAIILDQKFMSFDKKLADRLWELPGEIRDMT